MTKIRVVLARARSDYIATGLEAAIRGSLDLNLVQVVESLSTEPDSWIRESAEVDAVIVVGSRGEVETWSQQLLELSRELVVIRVTVGNDVVHFARRKVGEDTLLETLRALSSTPGEALRTADFAVVGAVAADGSSDATLIEAPRWTASIGIALAKRWLDAALLRAIDDWPSSHGELNLDICAVKRLLARSASAQADLNIESDLRRTAIELESHLKRPLENTDKLVRLVRRMGMNSIELEAFLLCLAPDLDLRYGRVFGYLQDNASLRFASLDLIATLLGEPVVVRSALVHPAALFDSRILTHDPARLPHNDDPLRVDPCITAWLLSGVQSFVVDRALGAAVRHTPWPGADLMSRPTDYTQMSALSQLLAPNSNLHRWLLLVGDSDGWRALVERTNQLNGIAVARIDAGALRDLSASDRRDVAARLARDVVLDNLVPVVDAMDLASTTSGVEILETLAAAFVRTRRPCALIATNADRLVSALPAYGLRQLVRPPTNAAMRVSYFKQAAKSSELGLLLSDQQAATLASVFALPLPQIEQAARLAAAGSGRQDSVEDRERHLRDACRRVAAPDLPNVATRVPPLFELSQVVLPAAQKRQLEEVAANVRLSSQVLDQWGLGAQLPYGRGVMALFYGPSGCGKTVAAQGVAHELGADLYVINLSRVMSKWVGETEKRLDMAFTEAENAGAVLLFDEADALFSRRISASNDSHARHSNIEIAFLLQRVEAFTGLAILTTNLRQNMDEAFLRRLRFVVEFPKPDAAAREKIWLQCFNGVTQLSEGVNFADLARRIQVSGGSIRQIALRAAFAAAADHKMILTHHIYDAARAELLKLGMSSAASEFVTQAA